MDCGDYKLDWHAFYKDGIVMPNYDMNDSDILMAYSSPVRKFIVQTMDETHVGTYEFRYIYSLKDYLSVTPSEEAISFTLIVESRCTPDTNLYIDVTPIADQPIYTYDGSVLEVDFSSNFVTSNPTYCPVKSYSCTNSIATINNECQYTDATTGTTLAFDDVGMKLSFTSTEKNDPIFSGQTHTFTITAVTGFNDDISASVDFTIQFRCFIGEDDFIWTIVPEAF